MKVVILSTATSYTGGAIITLLNVLPLLKKEGVEPYFILKGHGQLEDVLRNMIGVCRNRKRRAQKTLLHGK